MQYVRINSSPGTFVYLGLIRSRERDEVNHDFFFRRIIGNGTCIPQDFICDGEKDCSGGEDEAKCKMLKPRSGNR